MSSQLYDASGQPLHPGEGDPADANLPAGVQALIETRINLGLDGLRVQNERNLEELAKKHANRWKIIAIASTAFTIFSWFVAPMQIKKWVQDYIDHQMTQPMLKAAVDTAMKNSAQTYVETRLTPLNAKADKIAASIESTKEALDSKQQILEQDEKWLRDEVHIQVLMSLAIGGSMDAYNEILKTAVGGNPHRSTANAAVQQIQNYFQTDRNQLFYMKYVDAQTKQDPGFSIDELCYELQADSNPANRAAIVNTLMDKAGSQKGLVQVLCENIVNENDTRVIARTTKALQTLTGAAFDPLDVQAVVIWWKIHKGERQFQLDYKPLYAAMDLVTQNRFEVQPAISLFDTFIAANPDALFARSFRAEVLMLNDQWDAAGKDLSEISKRDPNYRWYLVFNAAYLAKKGQTDAAVKSLNQAFTISPCLVQMARQCVITAPLLANPRIKLPE